MRFMALSSLALGLCISLASFGAIGSETGSEDGQDSADFANQDQYMSDRYIKGPYLVYDCLGGHWACTGKEEFQRCAQERKDSLKMKDSKLKCAHFKKYSGYSDCVKKQMEMSQRGSRKSFCLDPELRQKL